MESYRTPLDIGDTVLMPCGTVGIINRKTIEIVSRTGGVYHYVRVYPLTNLFHRLFLGITGKTWFRDLKIDKLQPIASSRI